MRDSTRRTIRTVTQTGLALLPLMPTIVEAIGLPRTLPAVVIVLAIAAAITRLMAIAEVDAALPAWMRKSPPSEGKHARPESQDLRTVGEHAAPRRRADTGDPQPDHGPPG